MHRHELLLLANRVEEAERVRAEPNQAEHAEYGEAEQRGSGDSPSLAPARRREHEERKHQARRHLDSDARRDRDGCGAEARARSGRQRERRGEQHHDQRVVVSAADR